MATLLVGLGVAAATANGRLALLVALVAAHAFAILSAELLGAFTLLTPTAIALAWALAAGGGASWLIRRGHPSALVADGARHLRAALTTPTALALAVPAALLLLIAVVAPPNNWDSMTYHLPRAMHWLQNRSLAHFPARDFRLLELAPGSEVALLHVIALTGGDRLVGLVQWLAYVGSIIAVVELAHAWGASAFGQRAAAVFAATIPMAILQSTTTQNDLLASFWSLCFLLAATRLLRARTPLAPADALFTGLTLGLALHTKGTAYFYLAPFILIVGWRLGALRSRRALAAGAIAALTAAALIAPHAARNVALFGHPLRSGRLAVTNARLSPGIVISGILRNAALHLRSGNPAFDARTAAFVIEIHHRLGLDPDDPAATYPQTTFHIPQTAADEDTSGNPSHFVVALVVVAGCLVRARPPIRAHAAAVTVGVLLFCGLLRWQPYATRLHLGFFLLAAPLVALFFDGVNRFFGGRRPFRMLLLALLLILAIGALPSLLGSKTRPVTGAESIFRLSRDEVMFLARPLDRGIYAAATAMLRDLAPAEVGLAVGENEWEYPVWSMLGRDAPVMRQVFVTNASAALGRPADATAPPLVVAVGWPHVMALLPDVPMTVLYRRPPVSIVRLEVPVAATARPVVQRAWPPPEPGPLGE